MEIKTKNAFRSWKRGKHWVYSATALAVVAGGVYTTAQVAPQTFGTVVAYAAEWPSGVQEIGKIDGKPVVKSPTKDLDSNEFQKIVDKMVADAGIKKMRYTASNIGWQDNTTAEGAGTVGQFTSSNALALKADGYNKGDAAYALRAGDSFKLKNVGTVHDNQTGEDIKVDMKITLNSFEAPAGSATSGITVMGVKNQGGVITLGVTNSLRAGTGFSHAGGQNESGGAGSQGGATGVETGIGYIHSFTYTAELVDQRTGQVLPADQTAIILKASDIDASQLATIDKSGSVGYAVSPDTALDIRGEGLVSRTSNATTLDTKQLSSNSYVMVKASSKATVKYEYTDGANNHFDIVAGIFGNTGLELKPSTGKIRLTKSTSDEDVNKLVGEKKTNYYNTQNTVFTLTNKDTGESFDITVDEKGVAESGELPFGTYSVKEKTPGKGLKIKDNIPDITLSDKNAQADGTYRVDVKITDDVNRLPVKADKSGEESDKKMWNSNYSLEGTTFKSTHKDNGKVYTIVTDKDGHGEVPDALLGQYDVEETKAGKGFTIGFKKTTLTHEEGKPLTINAKNIEITGKVKIVKTGVETGTKMWNSNYSLAGNEFKLVNTESGKEYKVTTNEKGEAQVDHMQLGTYKVTEIKSSNGFANTFKEVETTLKVDENGKGSLEVEAKGTNQEITGSNTLVKADVKNGEKATGKGSLVGAEYTLFHADGTPVTWSETAKAKLTGGEKVAKSIINGKEVDNGDNVVIKVTDASKLNVGVERLALGTYYWKETNAPEGYIIDSAQHSFTVAKKDDKTTTVKADDTKSVETPIVARLNMQKLLEGNGTNPTALSGGNDIAFTVKPLKGTNAEEKHFTTGIKDDEDGFGTVDLEYGDWVLTEDDAPAGFEKIDPIYIHMSYDAKTDLYTITASNNEDGSKPFSSRTFSQSDDSKEKNANAKGTLAGTLTSQNSTISLSKITAVDKQTPPPTFEPHKFDVTGKGQDIQGESLLDDDSEIKDRYADTAKDPYVDKTDNNEKFNLNTKAVTRGQTITYQLWMDTTKLKTDGQYENVGMEDTFDNVNLTPEQVENVKVYNKKTGEDVTAKFNISLADGKLSVVTNDTVKTTVNRGGKDYQIIDTTKFDFGTYYQIEFSGTVKGSTADDTDIKNSASQFVTQVGGNKYDKITETRVNKVKSPDYNPHKFDVKSAGLDIQGESLLDDDAELKDRYADTAKDPYADKTDNNEKFNLNTKTLVRGQKYNYQLWMDTTTFTTDMNLRSVGMEDTFDTTRFKPEDVSQVKVYNKKTGEDVTSQFDIALTEDGKLSIETNDSVKKEITVGDKQVKVIDTDKFAYGTYYQIDFPGSVANETKDDEDIINAAKQFVRDAASDENKDARTEKVTETRVNKVVSPDFTPHKYDLNATNQDITGQSLLDDDSELKDIVKDTATDPYADKKDNNEKFNINTDTVKRGSQIVYQLWMDTLNFNGDMNISSIGMDDTFDGKNLVAQDAKEMKIYDGKTGDDVTKYFDITIENGKLHIETNESAKKKITINGEEKSVIDTDKLALGRYYKVDFVTTVADDAEPNFDIKNVASQFVKDVNGTSVKKDTETRVNKVVVPEVPEQPKIPEQPKTPEQPKQTFAETGVKAGAGILAVIAATAAGLFAWTNRDKIKGYFHKD